MKIEEQRRKPVYENLLPLVNVVFLLLIFFMVAGAFTEPEMFTIDTPEATTDLAAERKILKILMNAEGQLAVNNMPVEKEMLAATVKMFVSANQYTKVQLKADANSRAIVIVELLELLELTDVHSVHLITTDDS